ncbi:hypothetical protein KY487_23865, partial [Ralstonia pseudosolanacearum]|uniref:hypothetical protein n=1 Tax=Ralstonia pseudosolanacearum TaxID=1310165 RepID=UPI001C8C6A2B
GVEDLPPMQTPASGSQTMKTNDLSKAPCHLLCDADRKFPSFWKFLEILVTKKLRKPLICREGRIS